MKAFISYSHRDSQYLERLQVHLAQARRDSLISEWTDQKIDAGANLDQNISEALTSSELFLALVSPDYLASNYCYEKEFETALQMQEEGKLIIVPIIVEPCEWQKTPFGKLKAIPKDGKPVSEYTNQNVAFLNVVDELRRLTHNNVSLSSEIAQQPQSEEKLTRNYKVKKLFSEVDIFNFKEDSYETIKKYFQASISELNSVENLQARFTNDGKGFFTCLISNRSNNQSSFVTVQIGSDGQRHFGDLSYSFSDQISTNSIQMGKVFKIGNDDYNQFWIKNKDMFDYSGQFNDQYNAHHVAEIIWDDFISQVGVSLT
ncbi:toll/interleukin-1 receptor domain-containing protein [Flavobacterium qiangtangense]|uniref:Toll/interleukin-1 receptor domain-containing protein n=1 Tax=Flavobacterium qiangtangense TaxID=1442595 RepID=A0ABW1PL20_9FLAO